MQVQAINSFNHVNFEGKKHRQNKAKEQTTTPERSTLSKLSGPAIAAMFLTPIATTTLPSCDNHVNIKSETYIMIPIRDTIYPGSRDTIYQNDTIYKNDTIYQKDTINKNDTIFVKDTIYVPVNNFKFPYDIQDSLNAWRKDVVDIEAEGDDGSGKPKALLYASGIRDWNLQTPEYAKLNFIKSDDTEARYDHVIGNSIKNDIRVTKIAPGDITVVKKDGTETDNVAGLLFNEDGVKTFAHSQGRDKIVIYRKEMSGDNRGKFVEAGTVEKGYLDKNKYGQNVLLNGLLSEDTEDHYTHVTSKVMDVDDIRDMIQEQY